MSSVTEGSFLKLENTTLMIRLILARGLQQRKFQTGGVEWVGGLGAY